MNNALKFLLLAAGCALVVLLITYAVKTAEKGKDDVDGNLGQYSKVSSEYDDMALKVYDGNEVKGAEVKRMIGENADNEFLSIKVINGKSDIEDYIHTAVITSNVAAIGAALTTAVAVDPAATNYINDNGMFLGKVFYDENGVVACVQFTQQ